MQLPILLALTMTDVTYSLLIETLERHDSRFVMSVRHEILDKNEAEKKELRHRMLHHPDIGGKKRHLPVPYDGDDELVSVRTLKAIVRRFGLPSDIFDRADNDDGSQPQDGQAELDPGKLAGC